ncbi:MULTISPECIES: hypothetical protein [Xanthomonas]|uniref:hypothetical protein n=1 Tax=Xanthomonas TaxID=338 RepID=UPI001115497E|nr:hypothetical protein [Xanthomonas campestris]MCC5094283.1 hypothetical protein [Xanthomonas campestris pv. incanae]MEA9609404.1 hypothetical protein [Xanthomonas campestris pv. incanae]MEA9620085.1 hypothetical protein [Xanthomonas campestris pv. incanae]WDJ10970.1 hypothetical protein JH299_05380 [Xanthomonas campestris pv. incanae]
MAAVAGIYGNPERILFKTVPAGDWRKFVGVSNDDPNAGGGARDLRYNGFRNFEAIAKAFFPTATPVSRVREGVVTPVNAYPGKLLHGFGSQQFDEASFEPPTTARELEWRFVRVASQAPLNNAKPLAGDGDKDIIVLVQEQIGEVVAVFTTLNTLPADNISAFIAAVCAAPRHPNSSAAGFFDLVTGAQDHN